MWIRIPISLDHFSKDVQSSLYHSTRGLSHRGGGGLKLRLDFNIYTAERSPNHVLQNIIKVQNKGINNHLSTVSKLAGSKEFDETA